jgi:hypothetical protein
MATQQDQLAPQYSQIYSLGTKAGIKRDGTTLESLEYTDGVWCRFQRGSPKKMGGYEQIFSTFNGIPRGMIAIPYNGVNYVFAGNQNGLDVFTTGSTYGIGAGPSSAIFEPGYGQVAVNSNTTTTLTITSTATPVIDYATNAFPTGTQIVFSQSVGATVYTVTGSSFTTPTTTVTFTPALGAGVTVTNVYIDNINFQTSPNLLWQFDAQHNPSGGSLELIAHPGQNLNSIDSTINSQVQAGSILANSSNQWTLSGLCDSGGQYPTFQPISVSGGVCVLYPYLFVYGNDGYIANNNVNTTYDVQGLTDWNGVTANQVNMSSSKIVKGMPMRGGTNSPAGLFWATDSLIRVSFNGTAPYYWNYDIVSSQISIMSSNSVVEMDGAYYWMGVDRFYIYNGSVKILPNDKNVNWLFNNINYTQRQKVWATKVPRYNEIWFFYPRGTSTECNDAIIFNTKDQIWYDAGQAIGSQRSCGYTTEVFPSPIWADWNYNIEYSTPSTIITHPASLPAPNGNQFYISGDVTVKFPPGSYVTFSTLIDEPKYQVTTAVYTINTTIGMPGVTLITVNALLSPNPGVGGPVFFITGGYGIWQHETGLNRVTDNQETAIQSSYTTNDVGWLTGGPSEKSLVGINRRNHLRRVEPDFVQSGTLTLNVLGNKYANGPEETPVSFDFGPNTANPDKIDTRIEFREMYLQFVSNEVDGNYEQGRVLLTVEPGDERP